MGLTTEVYVNRCETEGLVVRVMGVAEGLWDWLSLVVLLVDGVRPTEAVRTVDTLIVACPEPLTVTGEVGDMLGDHVSQLGLACPEADTSTDEVAVPGPEGDTVTDLVFTLGVACPEADDHEPLGVTVPSPLELGVITADGDPVTVCPLNVIRGLDETVACADPETLGLPVGVE